MEGYQKDLIDAKYHLSVVGRMFDSYGEFQDKRFLVGIIREMARATSSLIKAYLIYDGFISLNYSANIRIFVEKIGPKYLDGETLKNILRALEIEKSQRISPIEYAKGDKIILLIAGKYRFLTSERLKEFMGSINQGIIKFPRNLRQV